MSLENKKKGARFSVKGFFSNRRVRYGGFSLFMIAIVIAVTVLVNVGVTAMDENWNLKLDATANQIYKISPQTTEVIKGLTEPIRFIALSSESTSINTITELLNRYRQLNPDLITVQVEDPIRNPTYANQFDTTGNGISADSVIVTNGDMSRFRVVDATTMYEYEYDMETYSRYYKSFIGEQVLTNAVVFVASETQQRVYFLTEHNEVALSSYSSYVQSPIEQLNMEVGEIGISGLSGLQADDILIVNAPQRDISLDERESLKAFLERGGKLLYMRNGGDAELENFESLLSLYGIAVNHDLVVEGDQANNQMGNPVVIVPVMTRFAGITAAMMDSNLVPVMPYVSSFDISSVEQYNRTITSILTTSDTAFGKADLDDPSIEISENDLPGPRTVGLTVEQTNGDGSTTKIVALGNSRFISTREIASYSGNGDLFFNSIRWLQGSSSSVSIVGKSLLGSRLNITSTVLFFLLAGLCVVLIPLGFLGSGMVVWLKRRHL